MRHAARTGALLAALLISPSISRPAGTESKPPALEPDVAKRYAVVPDVEQWRKVLYEEKGFAALERFAAERLAKPFTKDSSAQLSRFYSALGSLRRDYPAALMTAVLNEWCAKSPASHVPFVARGIFTTDFGWGIRGGKWANDVKSEQWRVFGEHLKRARLDLEKASSLAPKDPNPPAELIRVAMGAGLERAEMDAYYRRAIEAYPGHYQARRRKMQYLDPRWKGSLEDFKAFFAECLKDAETYPHVGGVALEALDDLQNAADAIAHDQGKPRSPIMSPENRWKVVQSVYERMIARFPDDVRSRSYYARWAYDERRIETAAEQFERIGDRYFENANWGSLAHYNHARADTYRKRGWTELQAGRFEPGKDWLSKSLALEPKEAWTLVTLAEASRMQGDVPAARRYAEQALALHPTSARDAASARFLAGTSEGDFYPRRFGDPSADLSREAWEKLQKDDLAGGKVLLLKSIQANPENAWALAKLAEVCRRRGEWKAAKEYAEKALALNPSDSRDAAQARSVLDAVKKNQR